MIEYNLDTEHSILHVQPKSAIEQDDFVETREGGRPAHRGNRRSCRSHHRNPVVPRMEESWGNGQPVSLCPRSSQAHKENRSRNGLPHGRCRRAFNVTLCVSGDQAFPRWADRGSTTMDHERLMMRRSGALRPGGRPRRIYDDLVTNTRVAPKAAWSNLNPSADFEPIPGAVAAMVADLRQPQRRDLVAWAARCFDPLTLFSDPAHPLFVVSGSCR